MSNHLPECPCNHADERGCFLISAETDRCVDCICPQLRACAWRVLEDQAWVDYVHGVEDALAAIDALSENPDDLPVSENPNDAR